MQRNILGMRINVLNSARKNDADFALNWSRSYPRKTVRFVGLWGAKMIHTILRKIRPYMPIGLRIRTLQFQQDKSTAEYRRAIRKLQKENVSRDGIESLEADARFNDQDFEAEILKLQTERAIRLASKYLIPYPENSDWIQEEPFYIRHLKREAILNLNRQIRQERKDRWEDRSRWTVPLVGLIGAVSGLLAVIHSFAEKS